MHETKKMKVGRPKSSLRWTGKRGRQGVSDIIGTILILAITVTLFSSIFFFVSTLPGPPAQSNSQFSASLGVSPAGHITDVNITYNTGPVLHNDSTAIYLTSVKNFDIYHPTASACQLNPYSVWSGLGHPPGGPDWAAGLTWDLNLANNTGNTCNMAPYIAQGDNITVKIVDTSKNVLLFEVTLPGNVANIPPEFINEGYNPTPVVNTGPFNVWVQVRDDDLNPNSVYANLSNIPNALPVSGSWHFPSCSCMNFTFNKATGTWNLYSQIETTTTTGLLGNSFPVTINATDNVSQKNSVVIYVAFTGSAGANIVGSLSASPGNPFIGQNTTITATLSNTGPSGGNALLTFTASSGSFCASETTCTQSSSFNITTTIAAFASGQQVSVFWLAKGPNAMGAGTATITLGVSLPHGVISPLQLTVFPKTLLVDGTGVAQGSLNDPFTFLTTDFSSANIPYTPLTALPGSSTISYATCTTFTSTNLGCYNIVVWDAGNATGTTACLSSQDATAFGTAMTTGKVAEWLIGADVLSTASCASASTYLANFGVSAATPAPTLSAIPLGLNAPASATLTTIGYPTTGMDLAANAYYTSLVPSTGASYMTSTGGQVLAISNGVTSPLGFASSFDLGTIDTPLSAGAYPVEYAAGTGPQAAMAYDVFSWLAGFVGAGPVNANSGTDWAVSQVAVLPVSPSFQTTSYVSVTVRDNGVYGSTPIKAILLVNGVPFPTSGAPDQTYLTPAKEGGSAFGIIVWQPDVIGYVTVGVEIFPPSNDSDVANNILYNSLFSVPTYIGYSVLVVDNTQPSLQNAGPDDTNSTVIPALIAAGFPASTINATYINHFCGTMPTNPSRYNLVVWNDGSGADTISRTSNGKSYCPLTDGNVNLLQNFLMNGGLSASLLFLGPGLMSMTNASTDTTMNGFVTTYLGTTLSGTTTTNVASIIGRTSDPVGDGSNIPYATGAGAASSNYTCSPTNGNPASFYYNTTLAPIDYWPTATPACAGTEMIGGTGWHTSYWAFDLSNTQSSMPLNLATLRAATFFGRLLPGIETTVSPPDITFSQVNKLWTNFDSMHPQLEQQYLIDANLTNLGASTANSIGISVYDGSHILASQSLSVAGSSESSTSGVVTVGVSTLSVPWTPLYAGLNMIKVTITTGTAGQILPGAATSAKWGLQVYFFFDNGAAGQNVWSHSQLAMLETTEDPACVPALSGQAVYAFAGHTNVPGEWPQGQTTGVTQGYDPNTGGSYGYRTVGTNGDCETYWPGGTLYTKGYASTWPNAANLYYNLGQNCPIGALGAYPYLTDMDGNKELYCPGAWGVDNMGAGDTGNSGDACYLVTASYMCGSLAILDDNQKNNYVSPWAYSKPVYIPADISSATASFWSRYNLAYAYSGGLLCVVSSATQTGTYAGTGGGSGIGNVPTCAAGPGGVVPTPSPGYTGTIPSGAACSTISVFTGSSAGGTEAWQQETVNLTQYAGHWVELAFNWLEGNANGCGGSVPAFSGAGWWINGLSFYTTNTGSVSTSDQITEGTTSGYCSAPISPATSYYPQFVSNDLWHSTSTVPAPYNTLPAGTQGAWIAAAPNAGGTLQLNPNMWDSLNTRAIDLTQASSATLNFQYVANVDNANYNPAMGLVLLASPVSSSGQFNWVQVWASGTAGGSGWHGSGAISLSGYLGEVIELSFVAASNCQQVAYPYTGAFLLSDVFVTGSTIVSAVHGGETGALPAALTMAAFPASTAAPLPGGPATNLPHQAVPAPTHMASLLRSSDGLKDAVPGHEGMATFRTGLVPDKQRL